MGLNGNGRPNLLLFGVGHSGTSILAKMLGALGWNLVDADGFGENVQVRWCNIQLLHRRAVEPGVPGELLRRLPRPWVVKDPRFVLTLPLWIEVLADWPEAERPVLLYLTRELAKIERTYVAYGETPNGVPGMYGHTVSELASRAAEGYAQWPFRKLQLAFEQVIAAAALFSVARASRRDRSAP